MPCNPYRIQRGTTPRVQIPVDVDLSRMDEVEVHFLNAGRQLAKRLSGGEVSVARDPGGCTVSTSLTRDETLAFRAPFPLTARVTYRKGGAVNGTWAVEYEVIEGR